MPNKRPRSDKGTGKVKVEKIQPGKSVFLAIKYGGHPTAYRDINSMIEEEELFKRTAYPDAIRSWSANTVSGDSLLITFPRKTGSRTLLIVVLDRPGKDLPGLSALREERRVDIVIDDVKEKKLEDNDEEEEEEYDPADDDD